MIAPHPAVSSTELKVEVAGGGVPELQLLGTSGAGMTVLESLCDFWHLLCLAGCGKSRESRFLTAEAVRNDKR